MAASPKATIPDAFTRQLVNDASQIESRCIYCGAVIVGSAAQHLQEDEEDHREHCPAATRKGPRSVS